MKKLLIINTTFSKGGAARVARDIFDNPGEGVAMYFAYGRGAKMGLDNTLKFGYLFEQFIHLGLVRLMGLEGFGTYFSTRKLIRYIEREKFDAVNFHNLHGYYLNFFQLVAFLKKQGTPVIWTLHDEWPITWLPAHSLGCTHCKTGIGQCSNTYGYPKSYFQGFVNFMLRKKKESFSGDWQVSFTCPSNWLKKSIEHSFLADNKIYLLPNGVDVDIFTPKEDISGIRKKFSLLENKKIIIFSASNLNDKSKGIENIIRVTKILEDRNYLFVGVGNGVINGLPNVVTTGYIDSQEKLADLYACGDVYFFASVAETFLLSAAEAMASGLPVVGFDLPVVRELINNEVGRLVELGDDQALASALVSVMEGDEGRQMGARARKLVASNFTKQQFVNKIKRIIMLEIK